MSYVHLPFLLCLFFFFDWWGKQCIGQAFALNEAAYFIVRLLQRFRSFTFAPEYMPAGSLPPTHWAGMPGRQGVEKIHPAINLTVHSKVRGASVWLVAGLIVDGFAFCLGRAVDVRGARARTDCIVVTCIPMRHTHTHPLPFHPHATLSWVQKKPKFTHFSFILLVSSIVEVTKTRLYESWLFFSLLLHILRRTLDLTVDLAFFSLFIPFY